MVRSIHALSGMSTQNNDRPKAMVMPTEVDRKKEEGKEGQLKYRTE